MLYFVIASANMDIMSYKPKFTITNKTADALAKVERARGFLDAAKLSEDWIDQMQNKALVSEAHHTTHIEGTQLTLEESEQLMAGINVNNVDSDDVQELLNYRDAFELVTEYIHDGGPITEVLIREIHKRLVKSVRGNSAAPGEYRRIPNYVVNSITKEIIYTPPDANEVPRLMAELVEWLRDGHEINPLIIAGIAQFQLVHIHPFLDGNGRTARLLSTLSLYKSGYDFKRLFSISEFYDRDRAAYYNAIQSVRENNLDLTKWVEYFVFGLSTQMQEVKQAGETVIKTDVLLMQVRQKGLKERPVKILEYILKESKATASELEKNLGINKRTLQRDLNKLIDMGLINVVGTSPTDPQKYYVANIS